MSKEWDPETVFDVLGCEIAREILAVASLRPASADALADRCGVSQPTIYRRINALQEYDMLEEHQAIDDDGHHHKCFTTTLEEARVRVNEGNFDVEIQLQKDYTDRFDDFWEDLEKGANVGETLRDPSPPGDGFLSDAGGG